MITNDLRIIDLTVGQLRELIASEVKKNAQEPEEYLYGMQGIATIFRCSLVTANKIKKSGMLDDALVQVGRKIIINKRKAIEVANKNGYKL